MITDEFGKKAKPVPFADKEVDLSKLVQLDDVILHPEQLIIEIPEVLTKGKIFAPNEAVKFNDPNAIYSIIKVGNRVHEQFALTVEDSVMLEEGRKDAIRLVKDGKLAQCFLIYLSAIFMGVKGKSAVYCPKVEDKVYVDESVESPALLHAKFVE